MTERSGEPVIANATLDEVTARVRRYMEESDDAWTFEGIAHAALAATPPADGSGGSGSISTERAFGHDSDGAA